MLSGIEPRLSLKASALLADFKGAFVQGTVHLSGFKPWTPLISGRRGTLREMGAAVSGNRPSRVSPDGLCPFGIKGTLLEFSLLCH